MSSTLGGAGAKLILVDARTYVEVPVQARPAEIPGRAWDELAALNDYLIDNVRYDHAKARAMDHPGYSGRHQTPEETLRIRRGVCQDYAALFEALARQKGFAVRSVHSGHLDHAWNEVQLAGRWWLIDVTWNDAEMFTDGTLLPRELKADADFRRRYFLTTVEREEQLKRAELLARTHRAPDLAPVDYERTREGYALIDQIEPLLRRQRALGERQRGAAGRHNMAVDRFNSLVGRHNSQSTSAAQERFKKPMEEAKRELALLREEARGAQGEADRLTEQIDRLYAQFRALADAHPLAVRFTLTTGRPGA